MAKKTRDSAVRFAGLAARRRSKKRSGARIAQEKSRHQPGSSGHVLGEVEWGHTPDVGLAGRRGRPQRTRTLSVYPNAGGVVADPAVSLAYQLRAALRHPGIAPAKLIDPKTGAIRAYMDAETRRLWQDPACTIPNLPAPAAPEAR